MNLIAYFGKFSFKVKLLVIIYELSLLKFNAFTSQIYSEINFER